MTRKPDSDTVSTHDQRDRADEQASGGTPPAGNPNERLEQWEDRYFEKSPEDGRGDPGPKP